MHAIIQKGAGQNCEKQGKNSEIIVKTGRAMTQKKRYKNPPIVERIVGVYYKLTVEEFEKKIPSWIEKIKSDYPIPENLAEWTIDIEQKNGVPFVKNLTPKARLIRLFWKKHPQNLHVLGMRLRPDRLVFHLRKENGNPHDFDELMPEMRKWLPLWAEHFGIPNIQSTMVEYYNQLNGLNTPTLVKEGGVLIEDSLTIFGKMPGEYVSVGDPYMCNVRLFMNTELTRFCDLKIFGDRATGTVHVNLIVQTTKEMSFADAISSINDEHDIILEKFDCVFTEKAKHSFGLI